MDIVLQILTPLLPTLVLVFGGQWILNRYETARKSKEQEIELVRFVRERQYDSIEKLYALFACFMSLYREINGSDTDLSDQAVRQDLLKRAIQAEAEIDALILRIGCEFEQDIGTEEGLERLLGHLRQAVQLWRESLQKRKQLPFVSSEQPDYIRFKETFAGTAAFLVHQIHARLEPPSMRIEQARSLLKGSFSNKYEFDKWDSN